MIQSKIIADSIGPNGDRLTTFVVTFPRIILAEFNTHRMFSRNSASSRAIPFAKMVKSVQENPFIPIAWQKDHKGMQGTEYFNDSENIQGCEYEWLKARNYAVEVAENLNEDCGEGGVTKQLCNRLLEPFMWHTVIITSGKEGLDNFFNLRCPEYVVNWYPSDRPEALEPAQASFKSKIDAIVRTEGECDNWTEEEWRKANISQAEIHIQALAECMWNAYNESGPKVLQAGQWHIPFGDDLNNKELDLYLLSVAKELNMPPIQGKIKIAIARCARVSYTVVGEENKEPNYVNDIKLHDRLAESGHWSPFEHCARVMSNKEYNTHVRGKCFYQETLNAHIPIGDSLGWCRNFKGFIQYRELVS
jgi:thymidylate synthase ThyX